VRQGKRGDHRITVKLVHTDDAVMVWAREFDVQGTGEARDSLDAVVSQVVAMMRPTAVAKRVQCAASMPSCFSPARVSA